MEQRRILCKTLDLIASPAFPQAQTAVRETACVLGFRDPKMWKGLSHRMKETPDHAENVYRHLHADLRTRELSGTALSRPDVNLLVELAYHGFATERG